MRDTKARGATKLARLAKNGATREKKWRDSEKRRDSEKNSGTSEGDK